jgi:hypothetical protein
MIVSKIFHVGETEQISELLHIVAKKEPFHVEKISNLSNLGHMMKMPPPPKTLYDR